MIIEQLQVYSGHTDCIYALCHGTKPDSFITGGADGYIVEWNLAQNPDGMLVARIDSPVYSLCISDDKKTLYAGAANGDLYIFNLIEKKLLYQIPIHVGGIFDITIRNNNIYTIGFDGQLVLSELNQPLNQQRIRISGKPLRKIIFDNQGHLYIGSTDSRIYILSPELQPIRYISGHENTVFAMAYNEPTNQLITGGRDAQLRIFDLSEQKEMQVIPAHLLHIKDIVLIAEMHIYITASMDKSIKIWDTDTHQLLKVIDKPKFAAHSSSVNRLLYMGNGHLLSAGDDKTIIGWRIIKD